MRTKSPFYKLVISAFALLAFVASVTPATAIAEGIEEAPSSIEVVSEDGLSSEGQPAEDGLSVVDPSSVAPSAEAPSTEATQGDKSQAQSEATGSLSSQGKSDVKTKAYKLELYQEGAFPDSSEWTNDEPSLVAQTDAFLDGVIGCGLDECSSRIDISSFGVTSDEAAKAYQNFINNNPQYFYVGSSASLEYYSSTNRALTILPSYLYDKSSIAAMRYDYENQITDVITWVPEYASDRVKAKAAHDWLVRNCAYNTYAAEVGYYSYGPRPWNAYGALVDKSPVCQGYSLAYVDMLKRLGVSCTYVTQMSANHGWNRVCVDGHWYHVDVTWDDPLADQGFFANVRTTYFLKSDWWMRSQSTYDNGTHASWSSAGVASDDGSYDYTSNWDTYSGPLSNHWRRTVLGATVKLAKNSYTYTGSAIVPTPTAVNIGGASLVKGVDYTVLANHNVNVEKANLYICGIGKYTGMKITSFNITPAPISSATVAAIGGRTYTGSAHTPAPTVRYGNKTLTEGTDYTVSYANNVNAGTAYVYITGKGNFTGTKTVTFSIARANLSSASLSVGSRAYTGRARKPAPTVRYGSRTLTLGTDYTISYSNNVSIGTARATITGMGNYTGTKSASFAITKGKNTLKVKAIKRTVRRSKVRRRAVTVARPISVKKARGKVTYKRVGGSKRLVVSTKTGKVKVKKGTKKGTYKVKIRVTASGNRSYKKASKTVTCRIVVK